MELGARRAAVYCRISSDPKELRWGVNRQEEDGRRFAELRGWDVARVYVDNDRSAWNGKPRPEYRQLVSDIRSGVIDAVIVFQSSRLHRSTTESEAFIKLHKDYGVELATTDGEINLSSASGRRAYRHGAVDDEYESEVTSERVKRALVTVAENGMPHGGQRPYGFLDKINDEGKNKRTVVHDPHEAAVIREATAALLGGASIRSVCARLNARGDLSSTGKLWHTSAMIRMLLRPRVIGVRSHRATGNHRAAWDPIIEPDEQAALRAIFHDPRRRRVGVPPRHLLSGVLRCGKCGQRMTARPEFKKNGHSNRASYACPPAPRGCNGVSVIAEPTEAVVAEALLQALDATTFDLRPAPDGDTAEQYRARQVELSEMWADGQLTRAEFDAARKRLEDRIAEVETTIVQNKEREALAQQRVGLRDRWPKKMSVEEKRAVIDVVIEKIVVQPGTRGRVFDPKRLSVVWKV
jgi:site-specific DNA recombinase